MKKLFLLTLAVVFVVSFVFLTPVYSEQHEVELQEENEDTEVDFHEKMKQVMQEQEGAVAANRKSSSGFGISVGVFVQDVDVNARQLPLRLVNIGEDYGDENKKVLSASNHCAVDICGSNH